MNHLTKIPFQNLQILSILKSNLESIENLNRIWMPNLQYLWISKITVKKVSAKYAPLRPYENASILIFN